jgi:simple sugar transport system permease protein
MPPQRRPLPVRYGIPLEADLARLLIIASMIVVLIGVLTSGRFFSTANLGAMSFQFPELGVFALAITLSLITGGIDLSIVSTANLAGILAALILTRAVPENPTTAQLALYLTAASATALTVGLLCGYVNGLLIARAGITPILATLGTMQLYTGLAFVITRGPAVAGFPEPFLALGNGTWLGVPIPLIIFAGLAATTALLLNRTRFGIHLYLMGTNQTAAHYSGIRIERALINTYALCGLLSSIAGILMIAHTNSAKADYGSSYLLQALLVAILGGVSPRGGFGTVTGLVIAVVSLQVLSSGFSMLRFSHFAKEFVWGAFLLSVMVLNHLSGRRWPRRGRQ